MKELLQFISEGGSVVRYHTRPGIKPDTDAHHSHGVVMLASLLAGKDERGHTQASATLLMACATHDLAEQYSGDMSAPAKRSIPGLRTQLAYLEAGKLEDYELNYEKWLTEDESVILQMADCFDGMLYCCRELALGNRNALLIWRRYCTYVTSITASSTLPLEIALRASVMFESIKEIYHETLSPEGPSFDVFGDGK